MVVQHEVREHARDKGDTHVDEYQRGSGTKVERFKSPFKGLSQRFNERREEYARSKDEQDLALSREEYLAGEEKNEETRQAFERKAFDKTHQPPLREKIATTGRSAFAAYQASRKPARAPASGRRSSRERVPPGYAAYKGRLYKVAPGAAPSGRPRRKKSAPRTEGVYGENDEIYR